MGEIWSPVVWLAVVVSLVYLLLNIIARSIHSPHRTIYARILDSLCELPHYLKIGPWSKPYTIHTAISYAMRSSGLKDVGGSDKLTFIERYSLTHVLGLERSKASFSPAGIIVAHYQLSSRMYQRIKFFDYLKKHPSIEKNELKPPIFVIGFPRTGTTFLHELLGLHPEVRMHYSWEVSF